MSFYNKKRLLILDKSKITPLHYDFSDQWNEDEGIVPYFPALFETEDSEAAGLWFS